MHGALMHDGSKAAIVLKTRSKRSLPIRASYLKLHAQPSVQHDQHLLKLFKGIITMTPSSRLYGLQLYRVLLVRVPAMPINEKEMPY